MIYRDYSLQHIGLVISLLFQFAASGANAAMSASTEGGIYGHAPEAAGNIKLRSPDDITVTNNILVSKAKKPSDFRVDSSDQSALLLSDADGDLGLNVQINSETAQLEWKDAGNVLSDEQLQQTFRPFVGKRLTVQARADVTVSSLTGQPTTSEPISLTSQSYSVIVPGDFYDIRIGVGGGVSRYFTPESGFPTTGFRGAYFRLFTTPNSDSTNNQYDWSSSAPSLVSVDSSGKVEFISDFPAGTPEITITAIPRNLNDQTLFAKNFSFKVKHWFISNGVSTTGNWADTNNFCLSRGYQIPSYALLTSAVYNPETGTAPAPNRALAVVGSLWSEWGPPSNYGLSWGSGSYWANESFNANRHRVSLNSGDITNVGPSAFRFLMACTKEL